MDPSRVLWDAVDAYTGARLTPRDAALDAALAASDDAGLPKIAVSESLGKFLHLLALTRGATRILEVGTLGGYSTIWLARAVPIGGKVVTIELSPDHARVARENVDRAGIGDRVEIRQGAALDVLKRMEQDGGQLFDMAFIDADKANIPSYFASAVRLSAPRGVIVVDNVVRWGQIIDAESTDPSVRGVRTMLEEMGRNTRVRATVVQTVGVKGHDGMAIAVVDPW